MEHQERMTTLLHLFADISKQVVKELEGAGRPEKIKEYQQQMQQINEEVKRIEKLRAEKNN